MIAPSVRTILSAFGALTLAGCGTSGGGPDARETTAYDGIASGEAILLSGTEPFWNARIEEGTMRYTTMEDQEGREFPVERFAGNNGLSFSGTIPGEGGKSIDVAVTPGECSDRMSDRTYPFVATVVIGSETRSGCAYTDRQPFSGPDRP